MRASHMRASHMRAASDRAAGSQAAAPGTTVPPTPMLVRTRKGLAAARAALPGPVVLVPTMGALHDGHRSPLRLARDLAGPGGSVLVSIFVNPLQFGPAEDYDRYPRPLDHDLAVCAEEGVRAVFAPSREQMYPAQPLVTVNPGPMGRLLEGKSRPGFFDGVLTVVLKLFQLTQPDIAVFGAKDAQQLALIRQMAADLDLGVQIAGAPLYRDRDGLAAVEPQHLPLTSRARSPRSPWPTRSLRGAPWPAGDDSRAGRGRHRSRRGRSGRSARGTRLPGACRSG